MAEPDYRTNTAPMDPATNGKGERVRPLENAATARPAGALVCQTDCAVQEALIRQVLQNKVGHIRPRDARLANLCVRINDAAVDAGPRPVVKAAWPDNDPVEAARAEDPLLDLFSK